MKLVSFLEEEPTTSVTHCETGKTDLFFAENYDHEHLNETRTIEDEENAIRQTQRRKSVSSRFRSVSKEIA